MFTMLSHEEARRILQNVDLPGKDEQIKFLQACTD